MALINCPECSKSVSNKARSCPHCGGRVNRSSGPVGWFFLIVFGGLLFFFLIGLIGGDPNAP